MRLPGSKAFVSEYSSSVMNFTLLVAGSDAFHWQSFAEPAVPAPTSALVADLICAGVRSEQASPGAALDRGGTEISAKTNTQTAAEIDARVYLDIWATPRERSG